MNLAPAPDLAPDLALLITLDGTEPLTPRTVQAVNSLCERAEDADARGPVVLAVSGAPAPGTAPGGPLPLVNKWERALRRLERLDLPTVTLVTGDCGGVALEALLATDVRIAQPGTRLRPPVGPQGAWPGMALYRLANQLGVAAARRTVLFGTPVPAERALALGLLDELAEDPALALADLADRLDAVAGAGAGVVAGAGAAATAGAGEGTAIRRQLMLDATTTSFEEALGRHLAACDRVLRATTAEASS